MQLQIHIWVYAVWLDSSFSLLMISHGSYTTGFKLIKIDYALEMAIFVSY